MAVGLIFVSGHSMASGGMQFKSEWGEANAAKGGVDEADVS